MKQKRPKLISLGCAALIAGCGGGGGSGGGGRIEPPTSAGTGPMTTALLRLQIPARGSAAARRRSQWISSSSVTLGVRVLSSPVPNPTPAEQVFALPSPGPLPTSTTFPVQAPLSTDTFVATAYDGNHNALATGSSAPIVISLASPTPVSITMLGVASGVQLAAAGSTPATWRVLENLSAPQTTTLTVQPVDADGNIIPGALATPALLSATNGVTLSSTSITTATSVTATYPSNTSGSASITSPLTLNAGSSPLNINVASDYYVFVENGDGTVYVIDGLTQKQVGSALSAVTGGQQIAALSGCASGAFAISGNSSGANAYFVPAPTTANPTPGPVATAVPATILSANPFWYGAAADSHCDVFYNSSNAGYPVVKLSGFDSTIAANPSFATGFSYTLPLKSIGGDLYVAISPSPSQIQAMYASESTGGPASFSPTYSSPSFPAAATFVGGSGSSVILVADTCSGQPVLQSLSGGSLITLSQFESFPAEGVVGVAQATDGTIYLAGTSATAGNAPALAYGSLSSIGTAPTITLGAPPVDVAVTPDQQYICVIESPSGSNGQIEFFSRQPTPTLVATVPLASAGAPQSFSIGP